MNILTRLIGGSSSLEAQSHFVEFLSQHGKSYATKEEFDFRFGVFRGNLQFIDSHNEQNKGEHAHKLGLNHMSDWTRQEYK